MIEIDKTGKGAQARAPGQAHDKLLARGAGFDHHFVKSVDLSAPCAVLDDNVSFNAAQAAADAQALAPNDP